MKTITLFKDTDRLKLLDSLVATQINLEKMMIMGYLIDYFPLHNSPEETKAIIENNNQFFDDGKRTVEGQYDSEKQLKDDYNKNGYEENVLIINENRKNNKTDEDNDKDGDKEKKDKKPSGNNEDSNRSHEAINRSDSSKSEEIDYYEVERKKLDRDFVLHKYASDANLQTVKRAWNFSIWGDYPTYQVRTYFGEKVTMYYEFMSLYTKYLLVLSVLGGVVFVVQWTENIESTVIEVFGDQGFAKSKIVIAFDTLYTLVIVIWSTIFLEYWKRIQARSAAEWGQGYFTNNEVTMPSFKGKSRRSPVDDELNSPHYPYWKRFVVVLLSYLVSLFLVTLVVFIVVELLLFRNYLADHSSSRIVLNMPTVINVVQIYMFDFIYMQISYIINDTENHRTSSEYEYSLSTKVFIFQFVNNFNAFFIIAFAKRHFYQLRGCVRSYVFVKQVSQLNYCDEELGDQLMTTMIVNFANNFKEVGLPLIMKYLRFFIRYFILRSRNKKVADLNRPFNLLRRRVELQEDLNEFDGIRTDKTFDEFLEVVLNFAYVTLFAIAFPLIPAMAYFNTIFEIEVDRQKLSYFYKRPIPQGASNIGNFFNLFEFISMISIFTNIGILIFSSNCYSQFSDTSRWIFFTGLAFVYIAARVLSTRLIPSKTEKNDEIERRHIGLIQRLQTLKRQKKQLVENRRKKVELAVSQ